jgi:ABC-type sugar transport system ATPase subunit
LHRGEILGFAGLVGAGRTEIMRAIFGLDRPNGGTIELDGQAGLPISEGGCSRRTGLRLRGSQG